MSSTGFHERASEQTFRVVVRIPQRNSQSGDHASATYEALRDARRILICTDLVADHDERPLSHAAHGVVWAEQRRETLTHRGGSHVHGVAYFNSRVVEREDRDEVVVAPSSSERDVGSVDQQWPQHRPCLFIEEQGSGLFHG
jgi:hypothetical protein